MTAKSPKGDREKDVRHGARDSGQQKQHREQLYSPGAPHVAGLGPPGLRGPTQTVDATSKPVLFLGRQGVGSSNPGAQAGAGMGRASICSVCDGQAKGKQNRTKQTKQKTIPTMKKKKNPASYTAFLCAKRCSRFFVYKKSSEVC